MVSRIPIITPIRLAIGSTSTPSHSSSSSQPLTRILKCSFSSTAAASSTTTKQRQNYRDPYAEKQAQQRRIANLSRQELLKKQRAEELGDPIRGITTPFVESFDTAIPLPAVPSADKVSPNTTAPSSDDAPPSPANARENEHLNHFLSPSELEQSLQFSRMLTEPLPSPERAVADPHREETDARIHEIEHQNAKEAILRIVNLANTNSKGRLRTNIQRCIDAFGRHRTDEYLKPRPSVAVPRDPKPRAGADTGSSEVQIAILTAKIRILANEYEGSSRNDKVNKRNLRLLLHRRQKLLRYLQRRERGGERWQNLISTLGLTEGTWKGQIAV
ncbi:MAG: hypothetical protein LQ347_003034 [Umbilicaria vellea]|nr:MAG: hypothetical protein LQ347_003034 [Umbilicaria vellea]